MTNIYHITTRSALNSARQDGFYRTASLSSEGFIHFSQLHQVMGVANAFYVGQQDLVILIVDPKLLKAELKYESPVHPGGASQNATLPTAEQKYPHLYGSMNIDAIIGEVDLTPLNDGSFILPPALSS
jgi:uncharacterized protein (DUF952 family)